MRNKVDRRVFLGGSMALAASLLARQNAVADPAVQAGRNPICAFIKFLQSLSYDGLADVVADAGFDGIEATIRPGGYIAPDRAPDELPKLADALAKRGLKITIVATEILRADERTTRPLLETAVGLGIPMYRLGFYKYDLDRPVMDQLAQFKPQVAELAALNGELGIQGVYQNHSGADMVGATLWDFYSLVKDLPSDQIDLAFDIRHTTIEAGLAWPAVYNAMRSRIAAVYVKDFSWDGRAARHVPLGEGRVDRKFFRWLERDHFHGPISLHVEYLGQSDTKDNIAALRRDLSTLRSWLKS